MHLYAVSANSQDFRELTAIHSFDLPHDSVPAPQDSYVQDLKAYWRWESNATRLQKGLPKELAARDYIKQPVTTEETGGIPVSRTGVTEIPYSKIVLEEHFRKALSEGHINPELEPEWICVGFARR